MYEYVSFSEYLRFEILHIFGSFILNEKFSFGSNLFELKFFVTISSPNKLLKKLISTVIFFKKMIMSYDECDVVHLIHWKVLPSELRDFGEPLYTSSASQSAGFRG